MITPSGKIQGQVFAAAVWTVKPGNEDVFLDRWKKFAQWTFDTQKGAIGVNMIRDITRPNTFISVGPWAGIESIQEWRQTPEFASAFREFNGLCDKIEPFTLQSVFQYGTM